MSKTKIDVAIALLLYRGQVLVGWREAKQHQGNKYEFPGGKVDVGEQPIEACRREIREEVGIDVTDWHPCRMICHDYDDLTVNLHVFHACVTTAQLNDIQTAWTWYSREALTDLNFPQANAVLIRHLYWQHYIKISSTLSDQATLSHDHLLYWRVEPHQAVLSQLNRLSEFDFAQLIVNITIWQQLSANQQQYVAAVHLKQQQLMQLQQGDLVTGIRYIAACHDLASAQHAQAIGCDAIFVSPIQTTTTHHDATPLGWQGLADIAEQIHLPIFALGGMQAHDFAHAQQHGAYGLAGIRFI